MRSIVALWLFTLLSLTGVLSTEGFHPAQTGTPVTASAYWERVRSTKQALVELEAEPEEVIRKQLDSLAAQWGKVTAVELSNGNVIAIDPSHLMGELKRDPPDLKRLESLLDALLKAHEEYPREIFTVQDVEPLKEILARPEFQWEPAQAPEAPAWFQKILDAIAKFIEGLSYGIQNTMYYGRIPLIAAAVILFVVSLYFISRNISLSLVREAQLAAENGKGGEPLTSNAAMQRAQTLSSRGDYRNAVRYLYLSSLLLLDERGLLRYDRSRTNREYLRSVSSKPELSNPLGNVIDLFDRVWYGFESVNEDDFQSYVKHVDELREKKE